jgi:hypothetical protein
MENIMFWQFVTLILGTSATYLGIRTLKMNNSEFIAEWEKKARKDLAGDRAVDDRAVQRKIHDIKKDPKTWRMYKGGRMLAAGIVSLFAFMLLVLLDIGT